MPDMEFFENPDKVNPFPFRQTWIEAKDSPFCILHTSGSTGIPKPVFVTHGTFACNDAHQLIPSLGGAPTFVHMLKQKRYFLALPLFHAACLTFSLGFNIFCGITCVLPPPSPLTANLVNEVLVHGDLYGALLPPSLIVDCYNNDRYCQNLVKHLDFLSYVGGALPEEVGNPLSSRVKLMALMGSCETALHPLELNEEPGDWQYLTISPFLGHEFRPERDELHDLVIVRRPDLALFQGVFSTFPEKQEFAMGDLFEQHPTRPGSWVFRARADDIIAFTTAEKLNPVTMESVISANPYVRSAVIGGQGEFQASLLLEPKIYPSSPKEEDELMKNIWPSVLQANRDCPAHGRIMRGFVMLTKPEKPMPRAGKDTVQRHAVLKLYAKEFKELYARMKPTTLSVDKMTNNLPSVSTQASLTAKGLPENLDSIIQVTVQNQVKAALTGILTQLLSVIEHSEETIQFNTQSILSPSLANGTHTKPDVSSVDDQSELASSHQSNKAQKTLRQVILDTLSENMPVESIEEDSDLFQCGLDSLQVPTLLEAINGFLIRSRRGTVLADSHLIYENPTIAKLVDALA